MSACHKDEYGYGRDNLDIWGYIQAVLAWVVRQGRLVVVTDMLVGLAYIMVTAAQSLLGTNESESIARFLWIVGLFCVVVIPIVILIIMVSENDLKRDELQYGAKKQEEEREQP